MPLPPAQPAQVTLAPLHERYAIGEPVILEIRIANPGPDVLQTWSMNGVAYRSDEMHVTVTGPDGRPCLDPARQRIGVITGNVSTYLELPPGDGGVLRLDLTHYAWLDAPGTYAVRLLPPFVALPDPPDASDPRWVSTSVVLIEPADPAAVVAARSRRSVPSRHPSPRTRVRLAHGVPAG